MALTPREVLRHAYVPHCGATAARILVQGTPPDYFVTWEDAFDLHQRFADAPGWGQAATYGEGNVSNLSSIGELGRYSLLGRAEPTNFNSNR